MTNRSDASLRTIVQQGEAKFEMVEHLMAALAALEVDNCVVEIDAEELPGLDGSSQAYVKALQQCGLVIQADTKQRLTLSEVIRICKDDCWIEARPSLGAHTVMEYRLSYSDDTPIGPQTYRFHCTPAHFAREVAPARTFVTLAQAQQLRSAGVASHVTNQDLLVIGEEGPIDNSFRFQDECARHKALDLVGDLALAGVDLAAHIVSFRGGHQLNGEMAHRLHQLAAAQRETTARPRSQKLV